MFEKEAEKRTEEKYACNEKPIMPLEAIGYKKGFKDGAEFAYNKANEWHDLEKNPNDLPKNNRYVWCDYGEGWFGARGGNII